VLWRREAGRQQLETPERRAALEARIDTLLAQIADRKVRRHYQHELNSRFNKVIAAAAQSRTPGRGWPRGGPKNRRGTRGYQDRPWERNVPSAASESLKQSPLVRGPALSLGARESLILLTLLSHPWLLEAYSEEIADLHLSAPPLDELRKAIIGVHIERETLDSEQLRTQLNDMGFGAIVARVESAITHKSDWFAEPDASPQEVETGWRQVLALHRKALDLEQELAAAERAFRDDVTDENAYERLVDIRHQLSDAEGTEVSNEDLEASASQPSRAAS
jgi:DNA primase